MTLLFQKHQESRATLACLYRTSGRILMLQLITVDSRHFTQSELSLRWSDLHEIKSVAVTPLVIGKDHGHRLIESAHHSLINKHIRGE